MSSPSSPPPQTGGAKRHEPERCPLRSTAKTVLVLGRERRVYKQGRSEFVVVSVKAAREVDRRVDRLRR
jgi:hypothetical protein